jgi:hypothetical protein
VKGRPATTCGDGKCELPFMPIGETCGNCPADCGPCQDAAPVRVLVELVVGELAVGHYPGEAHPARFVSCLLPDQLMRGGQRVRVDVRRRPVTVARHCKAAEDTHALGRARILLPGGPERARPPVTGTPTARLLLCTLAIVATPAHDGHGACTRCAGQVTGAASTQHVRSLVEPRVAAQPLSAGCMGGDRDHDA